jgi:hypothetical protein
LEKYVVHPAEKSMSSIRHKRNIFFIKTDGYHLKKRY